MSEDSDPLFTFFTEAEATRPDLLYMVLGCTKEATIATLRTAYRKAALRCHPDKHAGKTSKEREVLVTEFKQVGFAWAVLSDETKRTRYDATGRTDELQFAEAGEAGWEAYFEELFERVDRTVLDDHKTKYQGSEEELEDLRDAYTATSGSWPSILERVPHSTHADETRLIAAVEAEIAAGNLERTAKWTSSSTDTAAAGKRKRKAAKDAAAAEAAAKELGVWDEFYGSGKKGKRAADGKEKGKKGKGKENEEDALAALIVRRQQQRAGAVDALEAKYRDIEEKRKSKKGGKKGKEVVPGADEPHPADLDDDAFAALQAKMFGDTAKPSAAKKRKTKA